MNQAGLLASCTTDSLANPPGGVGTEVTAAPVIKFLGCAHQAKISFLNKINERNSCTGVATCNRDDETKVRFNKLAPGSFITKSRSLRQIDFLCMGEQTQATYVTQIALKSIFSTCRLTIGGCMRTSSTLGHIL